MSDIERIHQMVREGRITAEEGERLIQVLREVDDADARIGQEARAIDRQMHDPSAAAGAANLAGVGQPAATEPAPTQPAAARPEATQPAATQPAATQPAAARPAGTQPEGAASGPATPEPTPDAPTATPAPPTTPWVHVSMLAGDLEVRVDPALHEPQVTGAPGSVSVEREGADFRVSFRPEGGGFLDRFLTQMRSGRVQVVVPDGHGVDLSMRAGDVRLHGVPYLRGRLSAGDLRADALRGIDLQSAAGDISVRLLLTEGRHRIASATGDVKVVLQPGSSVRVDGSVSIGDAEGHGPAFTTERKGLGDRVVGTLGDGAAELQIHVTTGDVDVEVGHG